MSIRGENKIIICISSPWGLYYVSVRCFGVVHKLLWVLKMLGFGSKHKGISFRLYRKTSVRDKIGWKSVFHPREADILAGLDIMLLYTIVLRFWKISSFKSKPKGVSLWFDRKTSVHDENRPKICIYPCVAHIMSRLYVLTMYIIF
jgi:hypothetical protein